MPIYAGVLLDNSGSMAEEIGEAVAGALRFFETVITPKDRAAVITFNHQPELVVRFTNDPEVLAGGVAGITAEGGTALYDSLIYALYYFSGIKGKRAIVLLSDGADEGSHYSFEEALDYARRTGVAALSDRPRTAVEGGADPHAPPAPGRGDRRPLVLHLARHRAGQGLRRDPAGAAHPVPDHLPVLGHRPRTGTSAPSSVQVKRDGAEAKTIRGYYP